MTRNKMQTARLPVFRPGNPINNSIIIRYGLIDGQFFLWIDGRRAGCAVNFACRPHADDAGTCSVCQMAAHGRLYLCILFGVRGCVYLVHSCVLSLGCLARWLYLLFDLFWGFLVCFSFFFVSSCFSSIFFSFSFWYVSGFVC